MAGERVLVCGITEEVRLRLALSRLADPIPSTKGMDPRARANRLHAELERRIAAAKEALGMRQARAAGVPVVEVPPDG